MQQETKIISPEEYKKLSPYVQGYITYMKAEWPGWKIPKKNPHDPRTEDAIEWDRGAFEAYLVVLDSDDE